MSVGVMAIRDGSIDPAWMSLVDGITPRRTVCSMLLSMKLASQLDHYLCFTLSEVFLPLRAARVKLFSI